MFAQRMVRLVVMSLFAISVLGEVNAADKLANEFQSPPASARMWTWWFWLGDKVDTTSITADLEALKAQGIAGVTVYSISGPGVPGKGPDYMSPAWLELWKHTLKEAERLELGVSAMLCSGWDAGGPWITPELGCKKHVHSEVNLQGPQHFHGKLPQPSADPRLYRDVAVHAFPSVAKIKLTASSSHPRYPVSQAEDGDGVSFWVSNGERPNEGPSPEKPEWLTLDLGAGRGAKHVTLQPRPGFGPRDLQLQTSADGESFVTVQPFAMGHEPLEMALPEKPARFIRLLFTSTYSPESENVQLCEVLVDGNPLSSGLLYKNMQAMPSGQASTKEINETALRPLPSGLPVLDAARVIDLTSQCGADGELEWEVPPGEWTILRTGYTLTGQNTSWSSPTGIGLESDPLDAAAMTFQFENAGAPLVEAAGPLAGTVFRSVQIDSWEIGYPNWTAGLLDSFTRSRGYDPSPYLPSFSGYLVGSAELTERFLYDYRMTVGDLVADNYFGRLSELTRSKGILQQSEAGGVCHPIAMSMDCLKNLGRCDIPMGEFWHDGAWVEANQNKNGKQTASAAHLYGKKIAAAEAFTSGYHWTDSPATLKPTADRAFCEGFNHFFIFSSATRSEDGWPGTEFCAGTHFNRKLTWWNQSHGFNNYIARCSHLLQQGLFVADVLFYNGDGCPNFVGPKHVDPSLGPGYDYDVCNSEIILTRLAVQDGRIVLPDNMSYRVLVLPERTTMPVAVLTKLKELVAAGMTLIGPRPQSAPGLTDYPQCDQQVKALADEIWGECDGVKVTERAFGQGRVVWGKSIRQVLTAAGTPPDFTCADVQPGAFLDWIHRRTEDAEIYFIANRNNREEQATCTFRVHGRQPEIWDPVTGICRDVETFSQNADGTCLPLEFMAHGSQFIVFRRPVAADATGKQATVRRTMTAVQEISGPWTVKFDPKWGAPASVVFQELIDWTVHPEEGIRYYSGKATYTKSFDYQGRDVSADKKVYLDLGALSALAEVRLNGQPLGILWTKPFQVEVSTVIKPGVNLLEIDVVNLWPNRLIGDGKLAPEKRFTATNIGGYYNGEHKLLPSGLLGPVRLQVE